MKKAIALAFAASSIFFSCKKSSSPPAGDTRSFYMGVTPWPADFTVQEVDTSYAFINSHCDLVSHHFDEGIPYEEALNNQPMPIALQNDLQFRAAKTASGKKIMLSVSALDLSRKARAGYYTNVVVPDSIKGKWKQFAFNDSRVVTAYTHYISWLIEQLHPAFVNYGVESNSPVWDAAVFTQYKDFLRQVFTALKTKYPQLPFFISFMVDENSASLSNAQALLNYTDYIGLSAYPYLVVSSSANGNTDPGLFPADFFDRFISLDKTKPLAFAETGYIAENLSIPSYSLNKSGTPAWQDAYLQKVLQICTTNKAKLLIWFCSKDYNAANSYLQSQGLYQDIFGFWQDTGLKDEKGQPRPAYQTWLVWMQKKKTD